ncbi:MAG: hypothetical protein RI983_343 [Bacteroidota bacterium]|jgi:hypothetical protein
MKKVLFCFFIIAFTGNAIAQEYGTRIFLKDANGIDIRSQAASIENANYLFHPDYLKAILYTKAGKLSGEFKYKLLLQFNRLYYQDPAGADMEVVSPIYKVEFEMPNGTIAVFEKGFDPIDALDQNNFYQIVSDGKLRLLLDTKFATETKQVYGTGAVTTTDKLVNFYAASGTKIFKINKEEQVLSLMSDKAAEVNAFIKKEKTKFRKQSDLEKLFNYYNQLTKQ